MKRRNEIRDVDVDFADELSREVVKIMDLAKRRSLPIVQAKQAAKEGRPHPARK